tara:strand:+ start:563 stop:1078 length:516 start_codon:yes stop_codon:yes gene_type:complete
MTDNINWSSLDEVYTKAAPANGEQAPIPDGTYQTQVHSVKFCVSKAGKTYLFWVLEILEGVYAGRNLLKRNMLVTEKNMAHFKKDVAMCGVTPPESIAVFCDGDRRDVFLNSLLDTGLVCTQKTSGDFKEVYFQSKWTPSKFNKPVAQQPVEPQSGTQNVENTFNDDEIPF